MKILIFTDDDCAGCKQLKSVAQRAAQKYGLGFEHFALENHREKFGEYGVPGTPAVVIADDEGKKAGWFIGPQTFTSFDQWLKKFGVIE